MAWPLTYVAMQVECDIECLSGPDSLLVLAGQTGIYEVSVTPLRRGTYNGVLAFVARQGPKTWVVYIYIYLFFMLSTHIGLNVFKVKK